MYSILKKCPELRPFEQDIRLRMDRFFAKRTQLLAGQSSLNAFANAHKWYGFHRLSDGWVYREWAPGADGVFLAGDFNDWSQTATPLTPLPGGPPPPPG